MTPPNYTKAIQWLLRSLGATDNYIGFSHTVYAVELSISDPDRLCLVTKLIYRDVAGHYGTTWTAVERNMRTLVSVIWKSNPLLLSELAGLPLDRRPSNARFLAILAGFCSQIIL